MNYRDALIAEQESARRYQVKLCLDTATSCEFGEEYKVAAVKRAYELSEDRPMLRELVERQVGHLKEFA